MYERILLALDASEHRWSLVAAAAALGARCGAEVFVFHVRYAGEGAVGDVGEEARERLEAAGVRARAHTAVADRRHVAGAVARAADAFGADLVVMGSRGLGELRAVVLGAVSRGVITRSGRPILLIKHEPAAPLPLAEARRVLVAMAGPEDLGSIVPALDGLCDVGDVVVLHVCELAPAYGEGPAYSEPEAEARRMLEDAMARMEAAGCHASSRLIRGVAGDAGRVIAEEARACGAGVVVVGSSRRGGVEGVLLGSTARAVLHHSDCPVLIAGRGEAAVPPHGRAL